MDEPLVNAGRRASASPRDVIKSETVTRGRGEEMGRWKVIKAEAFSIG